MKLPLDKCIQQQFFSEQDKTFSKFLVGMSRASFDDVHKHPSIFVSPNEVIDSVALCHNENSYCENAYRFNNAQLSDIQSTFYLSDETVKAEVRDILFVELEKKYGTSISEKGIHSWITENEIRIMYIYLSDESSRFSRPVIQLSFITEGKISV